MSNDAVNSTGNSKVGRGGKRAGAGRKRTEAIVRETIRNFNGAFPSANPYQPGRSYIYMPVVDPRLELTAQSRTELLRKARFLYNAIGLAKRAIDGPAVNAVGCGISPRWLSRDAGWAAEMQARFEAGPGRDPWAFDASGRVNYYEAQPLVLKQVALDGDFFAQPLAAEDGSLRVRFIEGTFVGNSQRVAANFDEKLWFDGVHCDGLGRAVAYRVLRAPGSERFTDVPAEEMWHICRRDRHGYVRGASALAVAASHLHDMMDIVSYTKHAHKIAAQFPFTITTERSNLGLGGTVVRSQDDSTGQVTKTNRMRTEAGIPELLPGEMITPNENKTPGETFVPFMEFLTRDIAWGRGISPEALWDATGTGGANNRHVGVETQRFYEGEQDLVIGGLCDRYVRNWTWAEIESGRMPFVEDWDLVGHQRPAKLTVDNGRDGKLLMEQMASGFLSPDAVHAMFGRDGAAMDREVITVAKRRREMCAAEGMEMHEVFGSGQESGSGQAEGSVPPAPGRVEGA